MSLMQWNNALAVNVAVIDGHHQELVALINRLHDALSAGRAKTEMAAVAKALLDYVAEHFTAEERLMARAGYPQLAEHKIQHEAFVKKAKEIEAGVARGSLSTTISTLGFLRDWLVNHIEKTDKRYMPFMQKAGIH